MKVKRLQWLWHFKRTTDATRIIQEITSRLPEGKKEKKKAKEKMERNSIRGHWGKRNLKMKIKKGRRQRWGRITRLLA